MNAPLSPPAQGGAIEIVLTDDAGREDVLHGVLLGRFDRDHVEVALFDPPLKAIVARRYVRRAEKRAAVFRSAAQEEPSRRAEKRAAVFRSAAQEEPSRRAKVEGEAL